jgi:hypothetical protein
MTPRSLLLLLALPLIATWIYVTGPGDQPIELQVSTIVTARPARHHDHIDRDIRCLINTTDGKYVAVTETCDEVHKLRKQPDPD